MLNAWKWPQIHDKMTPKTPILAFGCAVHAPFFLLGGGTEKEDVRLRFDTVYGHNSIALCSAL